MNTHDIEGYPALISSAAAYAALALVAVGLGVAVMSAAFLLGRLLGGML